jgi:hypothetical protein
MKRRAFLHSLLGAAIGSCVRWLPMPKAPEPEQEAITITMAQLDDAIDRVGTPTHMWCNVAVARKLGLEPEWVDGDVCSVRLQ